MIRRVIAGLLLVLWTASLAAPLARAMVSGEHQCQCDEHLCRCAYKHSKPSQPKCRLPGGESVPMLKSCDTEDELAQAAWVSLLPPSPVLDQPLETEPLLPPASLQLTARADDISPPPPRFPLA